VPKADKRRKEIQRQLAQAIEDIRAEHGDISLRELCRRANLPLSTMSRAQRGEVDVSLLEHLIDLAEIWPGGDLPELLARILPEGEGRLIRATSARAALSPVTQQALEQALQASAKLSALLQGGDLQAVIRLTEALPPVVEAVVRAANAVGLEALTLRDSDADLDNILGGEQAMLPPTGPLPTDEPLEAED
jgi:hypothetical protein